MSIRILPYKTRVLKPVRSSGTDERSIKNFGEARVRRSVLRVLKGNVLCSMATVTRSRRAHINHAYFSYSNELELYFLSDPGSLHCGNLKKNASMAMSIFDSSQEWGGSDRGIQLFGSCREARGRYAEEAELVYGKRFRAYDEWRAELRKAQQVFRYRLYRFVPKTVKILDEAEFGGGVLVFASFRRGRA